MDVDEITPPIKILLVALEKIADEDKVYKGHGDYDIVTACTAEEAQRLARDAITAFHLAMAGL